ncbi:unnamed protein product [Linum trigynum]|uniref:Secreted protein n=1 Tax=Linum trigynum TaxID=586398 RepID=A0AAV2FWB8_9ROSI
MISPSIFAIAAASSSASSLSQLFPLIQSPFESSAQSLLIPQPQQLEIVSACDSEGDQSFSRTARSSSALSSSFPN